MAWHTWTENATHHAQNIHQYCDNTQTQKQQYYHHQEQTYHRHHFSHPSRPPLKGTLVLFPPSWDTLSEFWKELAALGPKLPCRKRLVLYFVFRGTSLRVCLGDAKAAGLLCVLGIGLGLGSLLIYRLFKKYQCSDELPDKSNEECYVRLESIDSIFNKEEMGQAYSHHDLPTAHYTPGDGVSFILDPSKRRTSQDATHIETPVRHRRLGPNYHSSNNRKPTAAENACAKMVLCDQSGGDNQADDCSISSYPRSVTSSLMGNYSPRSLRERNLLLDGGADLLNENITNVMPRDGHEKSFKDVLRGNLANDDIGGLSKDLKGSSVLLTPPSEEDSPSLPHRSIHRQNSSVDDDYDDEYEYEVKSENYRNLNLPLRDFDYFSDSYSPFSPLSRRTWSSCDEDSRGSLSPLSPSLLFSPDQLPRAIRHRFRDYKSASPDSDRSGSDWATSPDRGMVGIERCDSVDSSIADMITNTPHEIEEIQEERFGGIEDELLDLTSEMDELMSGLSSLKSKCVMGETPDDDLQLDSPTLGQSLLSRQTFDVLQRARSRWERRASSLTPESCNDGFHSQRLEPALSLDMTGERLENYSRNSESNLLSPYCYKNVPFSGVDSDNNYNTNSSTLFLNNQRLYSSHEDLKTDDFNKSFLS